MRFRNSKCQEPIPEMALAYIGNLVPDEYASGNGNFSRAANMWQKNLLTSLRDAGLPPSIILSQVPVRAFPNSSKIWSGWNRAVLPNKLSLDFVPFLNLHVLRPLTVGIAVLINLVVWGWRHRSVKHRIVYTFNLTEPSGLFTLLSARLIGAKAIASLNDVNIPGETVPNSFFYRLDFWLQKRLIPRFDGLVVVNESIVNDFAPQVPFIRVEGGVPEQMLEHTYCKYTRDKGVPFTIVSTGSLNEINGFLDLLQAFELLKEEDYSLHIAGRGRLESMIKECAKDDPRIKFHGYLGFEDVLALYGTADVLVNMRLTQRVNTNYYFPSKMMEYLVSGVPVITTCTGHVEKEYGDFVFLLRDETPWGLAQMIELVASMPYEVRAQKGKIARDYMIDNYAWSAQGHRVVKFIKTVLQ